MLPCLNARICTYAREEYVLLQGERLRHIMVLVQGALHIQSDDYWGNRSIVSRVDVGETFGEAYASPKGGVVMNDVVAIEESVVLLFDVERVLTTCSSACCFHTTVVQNLFFAISEKNKKLVQKLGHMSCRTTREKLISYLSAEAKRQGSGKFAIPFDRQQLADYLAVDRSAMSSELGKMQREGLLTFRKNHFELL